ncbi:MAG: LysR family transcriptional regulator [Acidobacteriia bacterium]|nr:LysR family transcriptional regulator [Terriglobia bacterium]
MDFDQLTTFVQVAKLGSFSRAGQKVFRSQSAVSAQIRQLEQHYGAKLLDRTARSVHLTPAGEALLDYAVRLLRLRDESLQAVADRSSSVQGPLVFGANEATCLYLLPDIFAEYQKRYPLAQISIYRNFSHKILQRIEDGSIDVGIVTLPVRSPNLRIHHLFRDRLMLMVSPRNPLANRSKVTLREVAEQPLIFPKTGYTRQVLDKMFRPYRSRAHVAMELPSIGMIKKFVAANAGVSFISDAFARDQVKAGEVKLIAVEGVELYRELGLVYRRDRSLPRTAQALIALIREHRKAHPSASSTPGEAQTGKAHSKRPS